MAKKRVRQKKATFKEKTWFTIEAPKSFDNKRIGDIIGLENNIVGRTIETLLFDFTDDYNDITCKLKFKVTDLEQGSQVCKSILIGHSYTSDFIRSLVEKPASKVTLIENFTTKDKYIYRITTVCVTIKRARSSQQIVIRRIMKDMIDEFAKTLNHEKFVRGLVYGEFQDQIARISKTIYPLSSCTVVKSKLISVPEGGEDKVVPDDDFNIVELELERSRKSDIKRSERINVKKFAYEKKKK
ncbi:MAG: hypothetical protein KGD63_14430 [Candidatus Lokiarchaeota archaeon]|nr:hypothetical protein [Candidatus Lokiarchaeota archaeon]